MKKCALFLAVILFSFFAENALAQTLLQSSSLSYVGAFRVTQSTTGSTNGFSYGGSGLAFNPANKSIFLIDNNDNEVAELGIPNLATGLVSGSYSLSALNTATFTSQNSGGFFDPTQGHLADVGSGGASCGGGMTGASLCGLMVNNNALLGTACIQYDASACQNLSDFTHSTSLSTSSFAGMYGLSAPGLSANASSRSLGGYLTAIPSALQSQLGGTVLSGLVTHSINSTTSFGPSAGAYNPANLDSSPLSVKYLVGYPYGQWSLTDGTTNTSKYWSDSDWIGGMVLPANGNSLLFFGLHAESTSTGGGYCYGVGTPTASEQCYGANQGPWTCPSGYGCSACTASSSCNGSTMGSDYTVDSCCYDPTSGSKGQHAYPYIDTVWAYDVGTSTGANTSGNTVSSSGSTPSKNNLTAVALGQINPWDLVPYAMWTLPTHYDTTGGKLGGATYDPSTGYIYISYTLADSCNPSQNQYFCGPVVEVYQVAGGTGGTQYTVTASAGANGNISPTGSVAVNSGNTQQFTVTPSSGYTASMGGTCGGTLSGATYTTNAITANCTVTAAFAQAPQYTITATAGSNGTISPSGSVTVTSGGTQQFTVTPANGYTASVGGTCGGTLVGNTYTTNSITANCTVSASFSVTNNNNTNTTGNTYSTLFPLAANPISENGNWINGLATGIDWANCATQAGLAYGIQVTGTGPNYHDAMAILNGTWGPNQTVQATAYVGSPTIGNYPEVELRLHFSLSAHVATGYEIDWAIGNGYLTIVRWNGPEGDFTPITSSCTYGSLSGGSCTGSQNQVSNGDVISATIDSNGNIKAYKNGTLYATATDTTYASGTPGMGFDYNSTTGGNQFGFTAFSATDQSALPPPPAPQLMN